jgi:hypothetical protein
MISKNITIEELIYKYPDSVDFLSKRKIRCIRCGEPIWGTLEDAAIEKNYSSIEIDQIIKDLNNFLNLYP